jgi:hypothetical protein
MLSHIPRGSVAIVVLTKALLRRHHALADVDGGIPRVPAGTDRVVQLDHVDVVAARSVPNRTRRVIRHRAGHPLVSTIA